MPTKRGCWAALLAAGSAALAGCGGGDGRATVEGTVAYKGEQVDFGSITLLPEGSGPKSGAGIKDGKFVVDAKVGPMPGPHKVEIRWMKKIGKTAKTESGDTVDLREQALPEKYNEKTELKADIKDGPNVLTFDLKP